MTILFVNGHEVSMNEQTRRPSSGDDEPQVSGRSLITVKDGFGSLEWDQREELKRKKCIVWNFVHPRGYICQFEGKYSDLTDLDFVEGARDFPSSAVVSPPLAEELKKGREDPAKTDPGESITVQVGLHDGASADEVLETKDKIAKTSEGNIDVSQGDDRTLTVQLKAKAETLGEVADLDLVRYIHKAYPREPSESKNPAESKNLAEDVNRTMVEQIIQVPTQGKESEYQGKGQVIAIADTGLDANHAAFQRNGKSIILEQYPSKLTGRTDDPDGHGTHVCGSAVGQIVSNGKTIINAPASMAKLVIQSNYESSDKILGGLPDDLNQLFHPPYKNEGARIHSNSWNMSYISNQLPYDKSSKHIDNFITTHPDMVICFSAGNAGRDKDQRGKVDERSLGSEAAAKNCITVGASENEHTFKDYTYGACYKDKFKKDPIESDNMADNREGIAAFSSRGPTLEGRIKPDVVAPGTAILSSRSGKAKVSSHKWVSHENENLCFKYGTSMATPLVASCCAVLREALMKNGNKCPSAVLIKALLINGAVKLKGQYTPPEVDPIPNSHSGFGRVHLANSLVPVTKGKTGSYWLGYLDREVREISHDIPLPKASDPSKELKLQVTMVYNDTPDQSLQNNLNLVVDFGGEHEWHGNIYNDGKMQEFNRNDRTPKNLDRLNNVEQVTLKVDTKAEKATVCVLATRLAVDEDFPVVKFAVVWQLIEDVKETKSEQIPTKP